MDRAQLADRTGGPSRLDTDHAQALLVFTTTPGSPSHEKLQLLAAVGD